MDIRKIISELDIDEILKDVRPDGRYRDIIKEFIQEETKGEKDESELG